MKKVFFLSIMLFLSLAAFSQQKMFLKVDGIAGESTDAGHKDWIDVFAFSGGVSNSGTMHGSTGGGGAGKSSVQDYSLTICLDKAVNFLRRAVQTGQNFSKVEVEISKLVAGNDVVYLKILMENVLISSLSEGGSNGEDKFTLNVSFNFAKYKNTYIPIDKGAPGTPIVTGWDIAGNKTY